MSRFSVFSDEEIDDLARVIDSAYGEGVGVMSDLVSELRDEFLVRNQWMPCAYSDDREDPHHWMGARYE